MLCAEVPMAARPVLLGGLCSLEFPDNVEANDKQLGFLVRVPVSSHTKYFLH